MYQHTHTQTKWRKRSPKPHGHNLQGANGNQVAQVYWRVKRR